jgi:hypothetical protein
VIVIYLSSLLFTSSGVVELNGDLQAPDPLDTVEVIDEGLAKDERHCKTLFGLKGPRSQFISSMLFFRC